jgi:hypothetical protein
MELFRLIRLASLANRPVKAESWKFVLGGSARDASKNVPPLEIARVLLTTHASRTRVR